jgi:hypothetical protein
MLHACVQRFDVTRNLKILVKFLTSKRCPTKQLLSGCHVHGQTASTGPVPVVHGTLIVVSTTTLQFLIVFTNIHANVQRTNQAVCSGD